MQDNLMNIKLCGGLKVPASGKLVYHLLTLAAGKEKEIVLSQRQISIILGISKGAVYNSLKRLRKGGYINIYPQYNDYGGRAPSKFKLK